jgi:hypothetical protein
MRFDMLMSRRADVTPVWIKIAQLPSLLYQEAVLADITVYVYMRQLAAPFDKSRIPFLQMSQETKPGLSSMPSSISIETSTITELAPMGSWVFANTEVPSALISLT